MYSIRWLIITRQGIMAYFFTYFHIENGKKGFSSSRKDILLDDALDLATLDQADQEILDIIG